jgi:hypothetical protein
MNQIEPINELPDWEWMENSYREISLTGKDLVDASDTVFRVGTVATVGFIYHSFTSPPWMWFALTKNVGRADLFDFRRLASYIPQGTMTAVGDDFRAGLNFARVYGFQETGEMIDHADRTYRVMRKI